GVVAIFTIGEVFPCDPLSPTYLNENSGVLVARTELQRRSGYMRHVNGKLRACGQLRGDHPLVLRDPACLHNGPHKRPSISEVLSLLDEARGCFSRHESEMNKCEMVRTLQSQPRNQNLEHVLRDLVTKNADAQSRMQDLLSRNQGKDRELAEAQQQLRRMEKQLTRAEETIRREQEMRERESGLVLAKDRELVHTQEKLQKILRAVPVMKDSQGIKRAKCQHCQCSKYVPPEEYRSDNKFFCVYCGHRPAEHVQIEENPPAVARSTHPREEGAGVTRPVQRKVDKQGTRPALTTKKSGNTDDRKWVVDYNLCWDESKRNPFIFDSSVLSTQREEEKMITISKRPKEPLGIIAAQIPNETGVGPNTS
ncbi:hypothetical protein GBAR_LOCUS16861, partial [Geodia barretti]